MSEITRLDGRCAFGLDPARYHESRPDYPERIFDILRKRCTLGPGMRVFEIGPGTGRATKRLLAMGIARLVAVEPDERLCAFLAETYRQWIPRPLEIRAVPFEEADLEEGSFDLGVAATSFHWLEAETALPRILRLLRPGGWWITFWDVYADPFSPDPFREATRALFENVPRTPSYGGEGRLPYALETDLREGELRASGFADVGSETLRRTVMMDGTNLRSLYASFSQFALMPEDRRRSILNEIGRIVREDFEDRVERTFTTAVYWGRRPEGVGAKRRRFDGSSQKGRR
jgi:SAM-dependent methyltransferase